MLKYFIKSPQVEGETIKIDPYEKIRICSILDNFPELESKINEIFMQKGLIL